MKTYKDWTVAMAALNEASLRHCAVRGDGTNEESIARGQENLAICALNDVIDQMPEASRPDKVYHVAMVESP